MKKEVLVLLVTTVTVIANLVFALTGATHTVSCTVGSLIGNVYAAMSAPIP